MIRQRFGRMVLLVVAFGAFGCVGSLQAGAQSARDIDLQVNLYQRLYQQGKYAEATVPAERLVMLAERRYGHDHAEVAYALGNLAELYEQIGRFDDAEPLLKRGLAIKEKAFGPDHEDVFVSLSNLGLLYSLQGRDDEVEPLYRRSLAIAEKIFGSEDSRTATAIHNLASTYVDQGRLGEAEALFKRALAIKRKREGPRHPDVGLVLGALGDVYRKQGRFAEAEPLKKQALKIDEDALGAGHKDVAGTARDLADLYREAGRLAEAEALYRRALAINEKKTGPEHPDTSETLNSLALVSVAQSDLARAADYWRRSTNIIMRRARQGVSGLASGSAPGRGLIGKEKSEAEQASERFSGLVKVLHRLVFEGRADGELELPESFRAAQWALNSEAAASLAKMAARGASGNPALGPLVRERQDLAAEWQALDRMRSSAVTEAPDRRDRRVEAANLARLDEIDRQVQAIDARLKVEFPDHAALASPSPLALGEVPAALRPDEALVLFLVTPGMKPLAEETFIWVVTKTDMRWVRSGLGTPALTGEIAAMRCGLDATAWRDKGEARCRDLLKVGYSAEDARGGKPLPFDTARAHRLYKALFGEVEDLIKGKHLLLVPSGPLTQLPFQVLVTAPPSGGDLKAVHWLARDHAITILPAVSSLQALRRVARPSAATKPMIGFGNPLLDGPDPTLAKQARSKQRCPEGQPQPVASLHVQRGGVAAITTRGGLVDTALLRRQAPLPETADELCAVARNVRADPSEMRLGARATEREVKALSASGALAQYRIVHFATHGTLAGQLRGTTEPGLILTPPAAATADDDGYLTASEIVGLKLDADWVILSACNTAAGGATGAEALSGLARAFFYAGARALLVSHWEVDSDATVALVTKAFEALRTDPTIGRTEAMRRSMAAMIGAGGAGAHPAHWAPFVVVGEGAR